MRLKNHLLELAMKQSSFEVVKDSSEKYVVNIQTESEVFQFGGFTYPLSLIEYTFPDFPFTKIGRYRDTDPVWVVSFEDSRGSLRQTKKDKNTAIQLFSALQEVFSNFIKKKKPEMFLYSARSNELSKVKLYDLIAKKISKKGYKLLSKWKDIDETEIVWLFKK
jgi:hypothetical protein